MVGYNHSQGATFEDLCESSNQFFLIICGMIVFFMQAGFAFLEAGAVRAKNTTNILFKNVLDSFFGAVSYWLIGWPLAFGDKKNSFCGYSNWASKDLPDEKLANWFFQYVFAATAATIISGAVAERCQLITYAAYSVLITGFAYPVVSHWGWDEAGWLLNTFEYEYTNKYNVSVVEIVPYKDFAGSGIVHMMGGTCALIGAIIMGPRLGKFDKGANLLGHSVPLAALGGFILFFGFFAINIGKVQALCGVKLGTLMSRIVVNSIISASFAAFMSMGLGHLLSKREGRNKIKKHEKHPKFSLITVINGGFAGMVSICAACDNMDTWAAGVTGLVGGAVYFFADLLFLRLKIDDPLSAAAVHMGGGLWGVIAAALLDRDVGMFFNLKRGAFQLGVNLAGAAAIMAWSAGMSVLIFGSLKFMNLLRVHKQFEINGLDIPKHGEPAYPVEAYGDGWTNISQDEIKKLHRFSKYVRSSETPSQESQRKQDTFFAIQNANQMWKTEGDKSTTNEVDKESSENGIKKRPKTSFKIIDEENNESEFSENSIGARINLANSDGVKKKRKASFGINDEENDELELSENSIGAKINRANVDGVKIKPKHSFENKTANGDISHHDNIGYVDAL